MEAAPVRPGLNPQQSLLEDDVNPLSGQSARALDENAPVGVLRQVELEEVLYPLYGLGKPPVRLLKLRPEDSQTFSEREGVDSVHGLSYNVGMCNQDNATVQEVRSNLRKLADEVWAVAKETDDRQSSSRLKALSSQIHHEAHKLGG